MRSSTDQTVRRRAESASLLKMMTTELAGKEGLARSNARQSRDRMSGRLRHSDTRSDTTLLNAHTCTMRPVGTFARDRTALYMK